MSKVSLLLDHAGLDPNQPIFVITAREAFENLLEAIAQYCPNLAADQMSKQELMSLIGSYGNAVIKYHPEQYHQERATLLENFAFLGRYGLTDKDYRALDFS